MVDGEIVTAGMTAEEFLCLPESPDGGKMELINGVPVTHRPAGGLHGTVHANAAFAIKTLLEPRVRGTTGFSVGFVLSRNPDVVRSPDVHFVRASRLPPNGRMPEGFFHGPPDLAIEVVDLHDLDSLVFGKVQHYQSADTPRVWVVRPEYRTVTVHLPQGDAHTFADGDTLTSHEAGFDVEGFALSVSEIFDDE